MKPSEIFINQYGNVRSGWRFAIFLLLFVFLGSLVGAAAQFLLSKQTADFGAESWLFIAVNSLLSFLTVVLLGWLCGKYLEKLPFRALGVWFTKNWLKDFG